MVLHTSIETQDWADSFDPYTEGGDFTSNTGFLAKGWTATGSLLSEEDKDVLRMGLAAEETYTFTLEGEEGTTFTLYDDGTAYDATVSGGVAQLTFTTQHPSAYSYQIVVSGTAPGSYQLSVAGLAVESVADQTVLEQPEILTGRGAVSGIMNGTGDIDYFSYFTASGANLEMLPVTSDLGAVAGGSLSLLDAQTGDAITEGVGSGSSAWPDGATLTALDSVAGSYIVSAKYYDESFNDRGTYILRTADELVPIVWVDNVDFTETDSSQEVSIPVSLSSAAANDVTLAYRYFSDLSFASEAVGGQEGFVVIEAGATDANISITLDGDSEYVGDNIGLLQLYSISAGATFSNDSSTSPFARVTVNEDEESSSGIILGTSDNDLLSVPDSGDANVDGGLGIDTLSILGEQADYTMGASNGLLTLSDGNVTYSIENIERLSFSDTSLALDIDANAGTVAKILGAVFGAESVANKEYAGIGLHFLDSGMSYSDLMELALTAAGATSNAAVVNILYQNLVGVAPSSSEAAPYVELLENGDYTWGSLGVFASELDLNAANIDLIGLSGSGLEYTLYDA